MVEKSSGNVLRWDPVSLSEVYEAAERTRRVAVRTPLVRLDADELLPSDTEIYLKLENLQPVRSYKLRGAWNQLAALTPAERAEGVWTVSSGNMAQAVSWSAQRMGVPCTVLMPADAPVVKANNVRRYGGTILPLEMDDLVKAESERTWPGVRGTMLHPFSHPLMMAGSGVIALEVLEDLPEVDSVIASFGGGGLTCGIAAPLRQLAPAVKVFAAAASVGDPLSASWAAGHPVEVAYRPSLSDAIAGPMVHPEMYALARQLLGGVISVGEAETVEAIRLVLERNRVVAEGGAAIAVAAAMSGMAGTGKIVCIISGGNIDTARLAEVLHAT